MPALPPPHADRRGEHGKITKRSGPRGRSRLEIDNGSAKDMAVSVVTGDPSSPRAMVYVRSGQRATVTGLSGTYEVYFRSGTDWDTRRAQFTIGCTFEKFDQPFSDRFAA